MSNVTDIWLFVQTSTATNANSKASLQLNVVLHAVSNLPPPPVSQVALPTASQQTTSNGINQLGASAQFHWSQQGWPGVTFTPGMIAEFSLQIVGTNSTDAWIPASMWVVLKTDAGQYVMGPQVPMWTGSCFSTDPSDCGNTAKQLWTLPWSQKAPIVEFTSGAIDEGQLEASESATYTFDIVNLTDTMTFGNMGIIVMYDVQQYQQYGVTLDIPMGSLGFPQINVEQSLPPGGRIPVTFGIQTSNATPQTYPFQLALVSWQIVFVSSNVARFYIDHGQEFSVVPD